MNNTNGSVFCGACGYQYVGSEIHMCPGGMGYTNHLLKQVLESLNRIEQKLENGSKESK